MQVYFSHSYRDVAINSYFLEHFVEEQIPLEADQKTEVWCVAKLERYLNEVTGFVSIIPRRPADADPGAYSTYIGKELDLARRARVPRLLFVDQVVFQRHRLAFPEDAVPFHPDTLEDDQARLSKAIRRFGQELEGYRKTSRLARAKQVTVVAGTGKGLHSVAEDVAEILKREGYSITLLSGLRSGHGLEDIRLLETLWCSELCVFLLEARLSQVYIALALAHAHCIPSIRLQYDPRATDCNPLLSGLIRWRKSDELLMEFSRQLMSYKEGLVRPVEMAQTSNAAEAVREIGTTKWRAREEDLWDMRDGRGLIRHIHVAHGFVTDEANRVRAQMKTALGRITGREGSMQVCRLLYDGLRRLRFGYEHETPTAVPGKQAIRTPARIESHRCANCLDVACLFAALLEAAQQDPIVVVLQNPRGAHALAGYRVRSEPPWTNQGIGDLRGAIQRGDAVLFEPTGAIEADEPIGAETREERREKLLAFSDAVEAAKRMLLSDETGLQHFVDVRAMR